MANETDTNSATPPAGQPGQDPQAPAPSFGIVGQYIRDLSFENPNAPGSIMGGGSNPGSSVNINVQVKKQNEDTYAVELSLSVKAQRDSNVLFAIELVYGGLFRVRNVPEAQLPPLMMIEAPRLLFPFARQVLANVTQAGGFPPLMMEPVDFTAIYRQNLAAMAAKAKEGQAAAAPQPGNAN